MGLEIERKFLVSPQVPLDSATDVWHVEQGYLAYGEQAIVRVRRLQKHAYLTVKGKPDAVHLSRVEYEYEIPLSDGCALLAMCENTLRKRRYLLPYAGYTWEIDVFEGDNEGLILAEVELKDSNERPLLPPWILSEVTADERYYNANLAQNPYKNKE